ncbi:hypothetical protein [Rhodococcus sp. 66b]|uniref:hypothetical protein n=1 Tax=Rhodococcus sp. 66b TaxID=1945511 RepID=UPI0009B99015|nr:hypothetical protein [Rhodococcus sp. 66b]OQM82055.1 hypothetical protein B0E55_01680 [Rhodococcus sp. 66b]
MTDITADEYRTAAKVDRHHGGQSAAQFYEDNARALEAVETEDITTQLAKAMLNQLVGNPETYDLASEARRKEWRNIAVVGLSTVNRAGRLIPPGGMTLTAEQVEDVRYDGWVGADTYMAMRKVGISEETAEAAMDYMKSVGLVVKRKGVRITPSDWTNPTPAEPAEEETKADTTAIKRDAWFKGYDACRQGDQRHNPHPASSPVVPAPTETGPWPTWEAVPEGVTVKSANGERFRKTGVGAIHLLTNGVGDCCKISVANDLQPTPFVAAKEG